jgi:hypothetical protein
MGTKLTSPLVQEWIYLHRYRGHVEVADQDSSARHYVFRNLPAQPRRLHQTQNRPERLRGPNCEERRDRYTDPPRGNTKEMDYHDPIYRHNKVHDTHSSKLESQTSSPFHTPDSRQGLCPYAESSLIRLVLVGQLASLTYHRARTSLPLSAPPFCFQVCCESWC